jgi:hypothetical protein
MPSIAGDFGDRSSIAPSADHSCGKEAEWKGEKCLTGEGFMCLFPRIAEQARTIEEALRPDCGKERRKWKK